MKTIMSLAAAVALAGILLTGCSTEADEKTAVTAAPTEAAATEAASGTGTEAEKIEGGALAGKKISVMTRISHLSRQTRWQAILRKIWKLRARKYS